MRSIVLILGAAIASAVVLIALVGVPFWISNGTFGRTFLDKPGFTFVAVNLSKNGADCYPVDGLEHWQYLHQPTHAESE